MKRFLHYAGMIGALSAAAIAPAAAQDEMMMVGPHHVPAYTTWQAGWDSDQFDRRHVILGTVTKFAPYRLTIARADGVTQQIDLKKGTMIFPEGSTPSDTQRVAVVGYYSRGTFVANRIVLHN